MSKKKSLGLILLIFLYTLIFHQNLFIKQANAEEMILEDVTSYFTIDFNGNFNSYIVRKDTGDVYLRHVLQDTGGEIWFVRFNNYLVTSAVLNDSTHKISTVTEFTNTKVVIETILNSTDAGKNIENTYENYFSEDRYVIFWETTSGGTANSFIKTDQVDTTNRLTIKSGWFNRKPVTTIVNPSNGIWIN